MRQVFLHDGTELQYDPTISDRDIERDVRGRMGLPPPEPTVEEVYAEHCALMQQAMQRIDQAVQMLARTTQALADAATAMGDGGNGAAAVAMEHLAAVVADSTNRIEAALRAPKVVKGKDGKSLRVEVSSG